MLWLSRYQKLNFFLIIRKNAFSGPGSLWFVRNNEISVSDANIEKWAEEIGLTHLVIAYCLDSY